MIEKILLELQEFPHGKYTDDYGKGFSAAINVAIEIVQEVAKEYGKDTNVRSNGWIPCSEQMPKYMEEVLVWHSAQNMHCVAWYNPSTKVWYSNDFVTEDSKYIVAWCELPAPYQKGE